MRKQLCAFKIIGRRSGYLICRLFRDYGHLSSILDSCGSGCGAFGSARVILGSMGMLLYTASLFFSWIDNVKQEYAANRKLRYTYVSEVDG